MWLQTSIEMNFVSLSGTNGGAKTTFISHQHRPLQCEQNHGYLQAFPLRRPVNVGLELQQPQQEASMARGKPAVNPGNCRCHFSLLDRFE